MKVDIVGPGRLGRTLHRWWTEAGASVVLVGRGEAAPPADVVVLCVPDRALPEVAAALPTGPIVLHCSGAAELDVLAPHTRVGSLHPLMTFPGPEVDLPDPTSVPAAIAGTAEARRVARELCGLIGFRPFDVPGDRRLYHASAVLVGNLLTVLARDAMVLLRAAGVAESDASGVWRPLAERSLRNAPLGLERALTGPVARGDTATLDAHARAMRDAGLEELAGVYEELVEHARTALAEDRGRPSAP